MHAQVHTLTSHSTRAHSELTSVGTDDHHPQAHGASDHTDRTRYLWLPAQVFTISGGSPNLAIRGSTANVYDKSAAWAFDGSAAEDISTIFNLPVDWNAGSITFQLFWAPSDATVGNVVWQAIVADIASGDQIDQAFDALLGTTIATPGVADQFVSTQLGTTYTPVSTVVRLNLRRDGANASDTYNAIDAWALGIRVNYTADM